MTEARDYDHLAGLYEAMQELEATQRGRAMTTETRDEANWRDLQLEKFGLLDEGQPTETAHNEYVERMSAPFTAVERRMIRAILFGEKQEQ